MNDTAVSRLHYELIRGLIQNGSCPGKYELAAQLGVTPAELDDIFRALAAIHGVVLHPHTPAPWIIHPFSLTPTLNWIEGRGRTGGLRASGADLASPRWSAEKCTCTRATALRATR